MAVGIDRGERGPRRAVPKWIVVGVATFVVASVGVGIGLDRTGSHPSPGGPPPPVVNASFRVNTSTPRPLPTAALGINVRADYGLGPEQASWLNGTSVRLVRWPGGGLSDRLDPLANGGQGAIYDTSGASVVPATSLGEFVRWCRSVGASTILTLPGEIDNASYAASIAREVIIVLGFSPAFWEIGNEPALWTHWGIPWTEWNTSQQRAPTPAGYASEVGAYIASVRSVDPSAQFLGLPGVGTGGNDLPWIRAVVAQDGPLLSALAIHVYPAGATPTNESPATYFASLGGRTSVLTRVSTDLGAIAASCPACRISLLIDEAGSVTGPTFPSYVPGYDGAPYLATEVVESLAAGASSFVLWNLQSTYPDAWSDPRGSLGACYSLYSTFLSRLPTVIYSTEFFPATAGLYGLGGLSTTPGGSTETVFLVNTNVTDAFRIGLSSSGFPVSSSTEGWTWAPGEGAPSGPTALPANATTVVLPPLGLGLWVTSGPGW